MSEGNLTERFIVPTVSDDSVLSWESQVAQYPTKGPPGISYFRGRVSSEYHVDCLLYRDDTGILLGILNRYPADFPSLERENNVNIWVHPDRRRTGIGRALIFEATQRWQVRRHGQNFSEEGADLVSSIILDVFRSLQWWR